MTTTFEEMRCPPITLFRPRLRKLCKHVTCTALNIIMKKVKTIDCQGCLHTSSKRSFHAHVNRVASFVRLSCLQISATRHRPALILLFSQLDNVSFVGRFLIKSENVTWYSKLSKIVYRIVVLFLFRLRLLTREERASSSQARVLAWLARATPELCDAIQVNSHSHTPTQSPTTRLY